MNKAAQESPKTAEAEATTDGPVRDADFEEKKPEEGK